MTAQNKKAEDDYYCVSLPPSEWRHIDRWLGDNVSLTSVVLTELNKIQKTYEKGKRSAVRIGIASIDTMIGGLHPGELLYVGSAEERYNFAVGLNIIHAAGMEGNKKVLVFNAGRGQYSYARSLISLCTGIEESSLQNAQSLTGEELEQIETVFAALQLSNISIISTPNISVEEICNKMKALRVQDYPDFILIDNLSFLTMQEPCTNRSEELQKITEKLWSIAKDSRIPIVLTGSLSKRRMEMEGYRPTAADLPEERMLKFLDKIVTVHGNGECKDRLYITVIKNPDGTYGYRKIKYDPACNRLIELLIQCQNKSSYKSN